MTFFSHLMSCFVSDVPESTLLNPLACNAVSSMDEMS